MRGYAILLALTSYCLCDDDIFSINTVDLAAVPNVLGPSTRIIGGTPAAIESYPYTVQILYNNQLSCAGSLLTRRHVLSAAHCFVDQNGVTVSPRPFSIRAGTSTLNSGGSIHSVSAIVVHERYNYPPRDNDIAVVVLSSSVTFGARIAAAQIPLQNNVVPYNSSVQHVGWGRTNPDIAQSSQILNEVTVSVVNHTICRERYNLLQSLTNEPFPVTDNMICAGILDIGGKDACQGDSGGPLIYRGVVVGVTSWGYGCAEPLFPGVSARVASYTNWINQTVTRYNAGTSLNASALSYIAVIIVTLISRVSTL